jgi:hypothetical protein
MKKPKSIFSDFEAHEVKNTASIEGGYGSFSSGSSGTCRKELTSSMCQRQSTGGMDNYQASAYVVDVKMDEYPD